LLWLADLQAKPCMHQLVPRYMIDKYMSTPLVALWVSR
jgi:hypothetical protein